jgi:hypothetical protein
MIGAVIRMIETAGRKKPSITTISGIAASSPARQLLHDDLAKALSDDEVERRNLSKPLLPHMRKFCADCIDTSKHQPFYRPSPMV